MGAANTHLIGPVTIIWWQMAAAAPMLLLAQSLCSWCDAAFQNCSCSAPAHPQLDQPLQALAEAALRTVHLLCGLRPAAAPASMAALQLRMSVQLLRAADSQDTPALPQTWTPSRLVS